MGLFSFLGMDGGVDVSGQAHDWVKAGAFLLDVRTPSEFESGHVDGAVNIPVQELMSRVGELPQTSQKIVVYCRSGARSANAAGFLRQQGYEVCDLGPMSRW